MAKFLFFREYVSICIILFFILPFYEIDVPLYLYIVHMMQYDGFLLTYLDLNYEVLTNFFSSFLCKHHLTSLYVPLLLTLYPLYKQMATKKVDLDNATETKRIRITLTSTKVKELESGMLPHHTFPRFMLSL